MKYLNKSFIVSMSIDSQEKWNRIFVKIKKTKDEQVKDDKQINQHSKK